MMDIVPASRKAWEAAQVTEHKYNLFEGWDAKRLAEHWRRVHGLYLLLTGAGAMRGKSVVEIGSSGFPAVALVDGLVRRVVVEPDASPHLLAAVAASRTPAINVIARPAEEVDFPAVDEAWLFNVLQHVMDPGAIVAKAKASASVVRFFEPAGITVSHVHLHKLSFEQYASWFGPHVNLYPGAAGLALPVQGFHASPCAYGYWMKG